MKRFFQYGGLRLLLAAVPAFLLLPAQGPCAEPARPAQGFIMNMDPLLGDNGRIKAIAPDCRAMTGILDGGPFVWSRDFGLLRLAPPKEHYGMGDFLSDDGRSMAGFFTSRRDIPPGSDMAWSRPGFLWRRGSPLQLMARHGLADVAWYGLSADGRIALGYGRKPMPGAPAADASAAELERFGRTGQTDGGREVRLPTSFWFCIENGTFRRMDDLGSIDTSPYFRVMSRDGGSILLKKEKAVYIVSRQSGRRRPLTFGGAIPFQAFCTSYMQSLVRAGDPRSPLFRWGRFPGFRNGRIFAESELTKASPDSPMYKNWILREFFSCFPSFDARFILTYVWLKRTDGGGGILDSRSLWLLARLDTAGHDVVIDDGAGIMALDISDDGRIVLYQRENEIRIWDEDVVLSGDTLPRSMSLVAYLKRHGLELPENLSIVSVVMSPDGRCFYMELLDRSDENSPYLSFLACTDASVAPPRWSRSAAASGVRKP